MDIREALAARRGQQAADSGDIRDALARRRQQPQTVLMPDEEAQIRENLPDRRTPMPTPPSPDENLREVAGQIGDVGTMVGKMAIPAVAGAALSAVVPPLAPGIVGSVLTGATGGVVGGLGTTAAGNLIEGRPITEGMSLASSGRDALIGGAFGGATGIAKTLLARRAAAAIPSVATARPTGESVADLPGYDEAISLSAPLPPVDRFRAKNLTSVEVDPATLKLSNRDAIRTAVSSPEFVLSRSENPWSQMAGERIHAARSLARQLRQQSYHTVAETGLPNLSDDERKAVTVALAGRFDELPQQYQTPEVADAAARMRADFYDPAAQKFTDARVKTTSIEKGPNYGKNVPFRPLADYTPNIPAPDENPGVIKRSIRGLLAIRRGEKQALMQRRGTDYQPADQALDELNGVELEQKPWRTDALDIAHTYIEGGQGRTGFPEMVARSHFFGAPVKSPNANQPWGDDANKLYQRILQDGQGRDAELFKSAMEQTYRPPTLSPSEQLAGKVRDRISHLMLGQSAATQFGQAATPVWRYGFKNELRGLRDYLRDPSFQTLTGVSGATESGIAREMEKGTLPQRLMQTVEGGLRGPVNAGAKPYLEDLVAAVQAGDQSAAVAKKLAELHLSPDELQGGMTADLLKRVLNVSADRNQFHPYEAGVSGPWLSTPAGKLVTQFQPFGHSAFRLAQEDVLEPLLGPSGWKDAISTGDYSLQALGAARAARMLAAGIPAAAATEGTKALFGLRAPTLGHVAGNIAGTNFGTAGDIASAIANGYDPTSGMMVSPFAGLVKQEVGDNLIGGHPERLLYDAAAMADPYGYLSFARPAFYNLTRPAKR